ncbi:MAG: hypothetical protein HXY21_14070, partial [Parvularculaceae bacterium]|nr:hypothetical protein [Parvularculaceae bacterium]
MLSFIERFLTGWTDLARRAGVIVIVLMTVAVIAAGWYAATNLKVNTD